jgi:hypothetical protein
MHVLTRGDGTTRIIRDTPQDWNPEDIAPELLKHREMFVAEKTFTGLTHVYEEFYTSPSKSTKEVNSRFLYKRFGILSRRAYACALVEAFNIFTAEEKDEMRRTKKGRKELRDRRPRYQFLVWWMRESDKEIIRAGGDLTWLGKKLVPISRMKSFFQPVPTQTEPAITTT